MLGPGIVKTNDDFSNLLYATFAISTFLSMLVCFRLNDNSKTLELANILLEKENYMIFTSKIVNDVIIRVALGGSLTQEKNIDNLIKIISKYINSN